MFRLRKQILYNFIVKDNLRITKFSICVRERKTCPPVNKYTSRTHTCGELTLRDVGDTVLLNGWVEFKRLDAFVVLRDSYGSTQLCVPKERIDLKEIVKKLTPESVVTTTGRVVARPQGQENKTMPTGRIEIQVESLEVLNEASSDVPFLIRSNNVPKETLQMRYRYLSLRFPEAQRNLRIRSKIVHRMREYLIDECEFVDVETPTLFKRTPGGAQEFVVPTRSPGQFYALVQSPQQLKQLLMIGGIDRYFQVARCYRDEPGRNDRQPEFTQLDIEMSFTDREGVMSLIENLLCYSLGKELTVPFRSMKYQEAMELYGTEQPDLRIPYRIVKLQSEDDAYALSFPNSKAHLTAPIEEKLRLTAEQYQTREKSLELKIDKDSIGGDVSFTVRGPKFRALQSLGRLRVEFADALESQNQKIRTEKDELLWVVDFPLFKIDETTNELVSMHHPFTQPHPDDLKYLTTDPVEARGLHYDIVMNGSEIGGGSVRIHNKDLQEKVFNILNIDASGMQHLLDALNSGAPPHAGIALGLDRLVASVCDAPSIRNVIAFPKTAEGRDLMSDAPNCITNEEEEMYHIRIKR